MLVIWYERAMALREIRLGGNPAMSSPSKTMRPAVGRNTPVRQLKKVDLPAPLGPMRPVMRPGIAENEQQKIFEEFHQAESSSTRKKGGTGLGLSIAKRIVELHGGRVEVESDSGDPTVFRLVFPLGAVGGNVSSAFKT